MKKIFNYLSASLVCLAFGQSTAWASSHREAPLISNDPLADNTDLYAFRSPCDDSKIVLIANYIPFEHPAGGPNWYTFGENIRYEIHVDNNTATTGDDIIYRFTFKQQNQDPTTFFNIRLGQENLKTTYTLERSINGGTSFTEVITGGVVPPPNIGPRSIENATVGLGAASYDALIDAAVKTASSGEKVFCGPADDPFFVDLGGAFDVGGFRNPARDGVAKFNCHSICVEVPISTLQKAGKTAEQAANILDGDFVIGVYASAYRRAMTTLGDSVETVDGDWIQVSRLGMPLTNEAIIPIGMKDKWNATKPADDLQFAEYFKNPELALYMDDSQFGGAVPGLSKLRIQSKSLGSFDFRNGKKGLWDLKGTAALDGTALSEANFGSILLPDDHSPRAVDLLPAFYTGVPNLAPYQLATGKNGNPLAVGKPFINNFLPTLGDYLRLNMAVPVTPRNDAKFSNLGIIAAAGLGLVDPAYNKDASLQFIPNMDGFPNGRRLEDDVTTIELQAVSGVVLAAIGLWYDDYVPGESPVTPQLTNVLSFSAGVAANDTTFKPCFPYVQAPWRGFTGAEYVLPIKWQSFTAVKNGTKVELQWQANEDFNTKLYEVERSNDGSKFTKIGTVVASGGGLNAYSLTDMNASAQQFNYYRIKQIDLDGKFTYSVIRLLSFDRNALLTILPNPAKDFIRVYATEDNLTLNMYDISGKKLLTRKLTNGNTEINIASFGKGVYTVVTEKDGKRIDTKKVVKQ
jgi:hypothetical protein